MTGNFSVGLIGVGVRSGETNPGPIMTQSTIMLRTKPPKLSFGDKSQFSINHSLPLRSVRDGFVSDPSQTLPGRLTCLIKNGLIICLRIIYRKAVGIGVLTDLSSA